MTRRPRRTFLGLLAALPLAGCQPLAARQDPVQTPQAGGSPAPSPQAGVSASPAPAESASISASPAARPLVPHTVSVRIPEYTGPAELRVFDSRGRPAGSYELRLAGGAGAVPITPRGALGPQRAELVVGDRVVAETGRLFVLEAETTVETGQPRFDELYQQMRAFIQRCALQYELDGHMVRGYRSPDSPLLWLRDHAYQARGFRYFEPDVTSLLDAFRRAQQEDGSFPDFLARPPFAAQAGRKQVEADVEFLFVQAVYEAWQASGDDAWLRENLPAMRRALAYTMGHPLRWDPERRLVKRPFTIDMWDFEYGPATVDPSNGQPAPRHWIDERTIWGIFHGDNTGLAHALELLARAEERVGEPARAEELRAEARGIMDRLNSLSWNGRFYTHHVPLEPFDVPGVDEARQLSLSNAYALNRGVLREHQALDIIREYHERGVRRGETFAEWYSIDPPFPPGSFGMAGRLGENPGEYVNGGIMPLVGGELARGAFRYGAARYAFEILHRYYFLVSTTGASYLWYYPAGNPGISGEHTLPTDGWGASAMLGALIEGAAGIEDRSARYADARLSPRWSHTPDVHQARVVARYAASDGYVAYVWRREERGLRLEFTGSGERAKVRLLLPDEAPEAVRMEVDGQEAPHEIEREGASRYATTTVEAGSGTVEVTWS
ncbi:MAG: hypothetical protein DIU80_009515 [Chloroflexota bacterium]